MNLTNDAWIPVLRANGQPDLLSLQGLFAEAHEIRDLVVKPHERVALMRLLTCITQAALNGPSDEDAWSECRTLIQPAVRTYLQEWEASFELFGTGARFLQLPGLEPAQADDDGNPATKLDLTLATGNNPTLFDNGAGETRPMSHARAALSLLTFQCFSPGGRIGVAKWNGKETAGKGSSNHAPCTPSSMIHTLIEGDSLLETIHRNLLTKESVQDNIGISGGWGKPVWELPPKNASDKPAIVNATTTYLGRLLPLSRAIRLQPDGCSIIVANGLDYPLFPNFRETTATVFLRKDELALLPASTGRALWRQLAAITVRRRSVASNSSGPIALGHDFGTFDVPLWVGALVTDKAKIEDVVEGRHRIPNTMLTDFGRTAFEGGVGHAEEAEATLVQSVKIYATELKLGTPPYEKARQHYWTRVEQSLSELFDVARKLLTKEELPQSGWGLAVRAASRAAYEQTCPARTPRQIQAFAAGLRRLSLNPASKSPKSTKKSSHE